MKTAASVAGMPLHALLIPLPLGALPIALMFNALHILDPNGLWFRAAGAATVLGAALLLIVIIPGIIDYLMSVPQRGEVRAHAGVHMTLGLALTGYFIASAATHVFTQASPAPAVAWGALAMNGIGVVGLLVQGYLGKGLVLRHGIGAREGPPREPALGDADPPARATRPRAGGAARQRREPR